MPMWRIPVNPREAVVGVGDASTPALRTSGLRNAGPGPF